MIIEKCNYVEDRTIQDAWREVMLLCVKNGWDFVVKGGSYQGQIRRQLTDVHIKINEPWIRPLAPILPPGITGSTDETKIIEYFERYILSDRKTENEQYTYGEFIVKQLDRVIDLLIKAKGNTNQATIAIGDVSTTFLSDPPCLRLVSFKVANKKLYMTVFFRSWDLYSGMPENLGGLQLLKEYVLSMIKDHMEVEDGPIIAYSDGLHIYEQYFSLANALNIDKIIISDGIQVDKEQFNKVLDAHPDMLVL